MNTTAEAGPRAWTLWQRVLFRFFVYLLLQIAPWTWLGGVPGFGRFTWQRYRRGYFRYRADKLSHTAVVWKMSPAFDSTYLFTFRYELPDSQTIRLWADIHDQPVFLELVRSDRHFQLAERQFHWLSEYNR